LGDVPSISPFCKPAVTARGNCAGGAIIEAIVAMGVVAIFLSGIHLTNSHVLQNVRSSLESIAATRLLSGRAEQLRGMTWTQITDASYLRANALGGGSAASGDLGNVSETIDVTAYLQSPGTVAPIKVRRAANGTTSVVDGGDGTMPNESSVRIDLTATWVGKGKKTRIRQSSFIVSQGGILGRK
jgi:hypothetical protein